MSDLEAAFDTQWRRLSGLPPLEADFQFAPPRGWEFDRCHQAARVAVELEGGTWSGGRHVRGKGYEDDCEKYNEAAARRWQLFRLTTTMLANDPARWVEMIRDAILARLAPQSTTNEGE